MDLLESRDVPTNLIPGWTGGEETVAGHFNDDNIGDLAVVALAGGSCHVRVLSGSDGSVILDRIVYDPAFRGGGHLAVVDHSLLVVPGEGGGPVVTQFDFTARVPAWHSFFAPYDQEFRGGLRVTVSDVDGDREKEAIFLPGEGGAPRLVAVDMRTHETDLSIWVGDETDFSGSARFEPTGGTIDVPGAGVECFVIQYDETVDFYAPSRVWGLDGVEYTDHFRG